MSRPKKDSELLHCRLDKKISDDLRKFCEKSDLTRTAAVERALSLKHNNIRSASFGRASSLFYSIPVFLYCS